MAIVDVVSELEANWNETMDNYSVTDSAVIVAIEESVLVSLLCSLVIVATIAGNILVILSVFTYRPLRQVQNFFIVSLSFADLAVALLVMPFHIVNFVAGYWIFGHVFCLMWLTSDVLCCTASILNLCAIAIDRYFAIHDPINYAQKRTRRRVLWTITIVWVLSWLISMPPLFGWNDWARNDLDGLSTCKLTSEKGYVIYSSSGSFYIPLIIMTTVYGKIFLATRRKLRERAKMSKQVFENTSILDCKLQRDSDDQPSDTQMDTAMEMSTVVTPVAQNSLSVNGATRNAFLQVDKGPTVTTPLRRASTINTCETHENRNASMSNLSVNSTLFPAHFARNALLAVSSLRDSHGHREQRHLRRSSARQVRTFLEEKQRISLSKERRAAKTMAIIMGAFVLCWLPFFLMYVILPFCGSCHASFRLVNFLTWLGYVNSALNPLIYTIFNIDFRRAFKKLLSTKC